MIKTTGLTVLFIALFITVMSLSYQLGFNQAQAEAEKKAHQQQQAFNQRIAEKKAEIEQALHEIAAKNAALKKARNKKIKPVFRDVIHYVETEKNSDCFIDNGAMGLLNRTHRTLTENDKQL